MKMSPTMSRLVTVGLWIWVVGAFALYLNQFRSLVPAILALRI